MEQSNDHRDEHLWSLAKKQVAFRRHFINYIVVNLFLWAIWYFTMYEEGQHVMPWPTWVSIGWGIGIISHYLQAFVYTGSSDVEAQYNKLKKKQS